MEKCLFVPLKLLDFQSTDSLTSQQRATLSKQALESGAAKALMGEPGLVAVALAQNLSIDAQPQPRPAVPAILPTNAAMAEAFGDQGRLVVDRGVVVPAESLLTKVGTVGMPAGCEVVLTTRKGDIQAYPIGTDGSITFLDPMSWEGITNVAIRGVEDIPIDATISLEISAKANLNKKISLSTFFKKTIPAGQASTVATTAATGSTGADVLLAEHLRRNRLYYNQALWRSLDAATLALLLSPYKYRGKPLMEIIDATPVSIVGNYLIFRMPVDPSEDNDDENTDERWATWLRKHGLMNDDGTRLGPVRQDLVPLPSGGVFAEAVLGRSNSAELLDITRFWNWQDSPIPLQPTEILPVSTESRDQPADLKPGEFAGPLVNIVSPTTLPDPQGMAAVLSAISNGNMFRDMSGLAATIGLAGQSLQSTSGQAQQAAAQAGQNMKTAADFIAAIAAIAASAITGKPVSPPGQSSPSAAGGAVNQGKKMDQSAQQNGKPGKNTPQAPSSGSSSGGTPSPGAAPTPGFEAQAFDSFVGGGVSTPMGALLQLVMRALPADGGTGTAAATTLTLGEKVPNKPETAVVGAIAGKVVRNTPEFNALVKNTNDKIVFKDEEGSGADLMMTTRLRDGLNELANLVEKEWPGKKLRVTEAWDESNEHSADSTHYEGRAADITVSDVDPAKLGRLAQLAVDAGLDWVFYENSVHVHVSVTK